MFTAAGQLDARERVRVERAVGLGVATLGAELRERARSLAVNPAALPSAAHFVPAGADIGQPAGVAALAQAAMRAGTPQHGWVAGPGGPDLAAAAPLADGRGAVLLLGLQTANSLAERSGVADLRLGADPAEKQGWALATADGVVVGSLSWRVDSSGGRLLQASLPLNAGAFVLVSLFATALWVQLRGAFGRLRAAYEEIAVNERRHRRFLEASPDHWLHLDGRGVLLDHAGPDAYLFGGALRLRRPLDEVLPSAIAERVSQLARDAITGGRSQRVELTDEAGRQTYEFHAVRLGADEAVITASDISFRKWAEARLVHQAHYDGLTDLPNRTLVLTRLEQAMALADRNGRMCGVAMLDLDGFKDVNDTLGHAAGDRLLVEVGARLSACVRKTDTVGRMGGDEFLVVLSDLEHESDIEVVAGKVLAALCRTAVVEGHEVMVSGVMGLCVYPRDAADAETLLRHADAALYAAKREGRGLARCFRPELNEELKFRVEVEKRLRRALANGELALHFQPLVDTRTGAVECAEALLRWNTPDMPPIGPDRFVPIAESTGLIMEIGRWVLNEACDAAMDWRRRTGRPLSVAVNLSARQFRGDIVGEVTAALERSGLPASALELEITESLLLDDIHSEALFRLKELGVRLSIDDFGTGFSSLSYLRRFPFDTLKIDRSFVSEVTSSASDATLTRTIVTMARNLGLATVGEGVEHEDQRAFLEDCGCSHVQGFAISRPLPRRDFEDWLLRLAPAEAALAGA